MSPSYQDLMAAVVVEIDGRQVDPAHVIEQDLHRGRHWYHIYRAVQRHGDRALFAQHVARMFEDPQHPAVPEMLGAGRDALANTPLWTLAITAPELVPIDIVRVLAKSPNASVRDAAIELLGIVHDAEDAEAVLAHHLARGQTLSFQKTHDVLWLAGLADSDRLVPLLEPRSLFELTRRRRCANLTTAARDRARALLAMERAEEWVSRIAFELDDHALAAELATRRPAKMIEQWVTQPVRLHTGDERFLAGQLDDTNNVDASAYAAYAYVLRIEPDHAHAAFQLAWIDRAYGTPITEARIAWLRELGVRDEALLDELGLPTTPITGHRMRRYTAPTHAERTAMERHLARVRAATGSAADPAEPRS